MAMGINPKAFDSIENINKPECQAQITMMLADMALSVRIAAGDELHQVEQVLYGLLESQLPPNLMKLMMYNLLLTYEVVRTGGPRTGAEQVAVNYMETFFTSPAVQEFLNDVLRFRDDDVKE